MLMTSNNVSDDADNDNYQHTTVHLSLSSLSILTYMHNAVDNGCNNSGNIDDNGTVTYTATTTTSDGDGGDDDGNEEGEEDDGNDNNKICNVQYL